MNVKLRGRASSNGAANVQREFDSPFIAAKREWNERYGDYIAQARNWRIAAILALLVSAVLAGGSIWLAAQTKFVPYVVEVDKLGQSIAVARADRAPIADQAIVRAQLASWITDARAVSSDPTAERVLLTRVYSLIGATAKPYLDDWYRTHSPFETGKNHTVSVTISAVLPLSPMTYSVQWAEEQRDPDGSHPVTTHWEANVSVGLNPPTDEATILRNPMGIYVTQLNWTQRL
jgi:type IV secretory pathway TrbF-like protein